MNAIKSIHVKGFRSLADFKVEDLPNPTVMIGPNGAGKSNVFRFLEMVGRMLTPPSGGLARFVHAQGGADDQLFGGCRRTRRVDADLALHTTAGRADYRFALTHANPLMILDPPASSRDFTLTHANSDRLVFADERFRLRNGDRPSGSPPQAWHELGSGHAEAKLQLRAGGAAQRQHHRLVALHRVLDVADAGSDDADDAGSAARAIVATLGGCSCYHFHDTSNRSRIRTPADASDRRRLRCDAGNLAAVLHFLERNDMRRYESICNYVGRVLPPFDRFAIEERRDRLTLRWKAKGSDKARGAHLASDGSLRTFALMTLLNLPLDLLPSVVLLDEPELGLHPAAVSLVGGMIRSLSSQRQIIVATQSSLLVDVFELEKLLVLGLDGDATTVQRPKSEDYREWLGECSTGQLWEKNLLDGYP